MIYTGEKLREISFPLGGIGSGCIGLRGNGRLADWEIFNRPSKGSINGYSHFAIRAKLGDGTVITRVLNGDIDKDLCGQYTKISNNGYGVGLSRLTMSGFPHFRDCTFKGEFPIAEITLRDDSFPGKAPTLKLLFIL